VAVFVNKQTNKQKAYTKIESISICSKTAKYVYSFGILEVYNSYTCKYLISSNNLTQKPCVCKKFQKKKEKNDMFLKFALAIYKDTFNTPL